MKVREPRRLFALAVVMTIAATASIGAAGQAAKTTGSKPKPAGRTVAPRTPWGHPDLQGTWSNATTTPLERPSNQSKQSLNDEEQAQLDQQVLAQRNTDKTPRQGDPGTYNEFW